MEHFNLKITPLFTVNTNDYQYLCKIRCVVLPVLDLPIENFQNIFMSRHIDKIVIIQKFHAQKDLEVQKILLVINENGDLADGAIDLKQTANEECLIKQCGHFY